MHHISSGRRRTGGRGFVRISQTDAEQDEGVDTEPNNLEQRYRPEPDRTRATVRQAHQQSAISPPYYNRTFLSTHSSPALSDSTLVGEDYLTLPIQNFDENFYEVDISDRTRRYAELSNYHLPEVVEDDVGVSYSSSIKAGKGLEVRVESYPLALSPGGLYIDDRQQEDFSYRGAEGMDDEKSSPAALPRYDYKPVPLRWQFVLSLLGGLIIFLTMWELSLRLLPDASRMGGSLAVFQNVSEIRKRSLISFEPRNFTTNLPQVDGTQSVSNSDESRNSGVGNHAKPGTGGNTKGGGENGNHETSSDTRRSTTKATPTTESRDQTTTSTQPETTKDSESEATGTGGNGPTAPSSATATQSSDVSSTSSFSRSTKPTMTPATKSPDAGATESPSRPTKSTTTSAIKSLDPSPTNSPSPTTKGTATTTNDSRTDISSSSQKPTLAGTTEGTSTDDASTDEPSRQGTSTSSTHGSSTETTGTTVGTNQAVTTGDPTTPATSSPTRTRHHQSTTPTSATTSTDPSSNTDDATSPSPSPPTFTRTKSEETTSPSPLSSKSPPPTTTSTDPPRLTDILTSILNPEQLPTPTGAGSGEDSSSHATATATSIETHGSGPTGGPQHSNGTTAEGITPILTMKPTKTDPGNGAPTPSKDSGTTIPGTIPTTTTGPTKHGQTGNHGTTATTWPSIDIPIGNNTLTNSPTNRPEQTTATGGKPPVSTEGKPPASTEGRPPASTGSDAPHQPDGPVRNSTSIPDDLPNTTAPGSGNDSSSGGQFGGHLGGEMTRTGTRPTETITPGTTVVGVNATGTDIPPHTITSSSHILGTQRPHTGTQAHLASNHGSADDATSTGHATAFTTITLEQETDTSFEPSTSTFTTDSTVASGIVVQTTVVLTVPHMKAADPLTSYLATTTLSDGTVSTISRVVLDNIETETEYDSSGRPTKTKFIHILTGARTTTLVDGVGRPLATVEFYGVETTSTLYDKDNIPTATVVTEVPETVSWSTVYDENGRFVKAVRILMPIPTSTVGPAVLPTPTPTGSPSKPDDHRTLKLHRISDGLYFAGLMLPTLLAVLVTVPLKILNQTVKLYQGFHALASDRGASAADSLWLKTTGPASFVDGLMSFKSRHYLLGLTSVLMILGAFTIPFSAEVYRLVLEGPDCNANKDGGSTITCSVVLGVYPALSRVLSALIIVLIVGIIAVAIILRRWKTGLERNPWNIADMARLSAGTDMRKILERLRRHSHNHGSHGQPGYKVDNQDFVNKLRTKTFGLRPWEQNGVMKYSILILTQQVDDNPKPINKAGRTVAFADQADSRLKKRFHWPNADLLPFSILSFTGRILLMVLLVGVLIAVITYDVVARGSEYRRGITGKAIGVRFLFAGAGVLITFAWGSFFNAVAFLSPYKLLHSKRLNKSQAITMTPPTNPFTGAWLAFVPARRDVYLGLVSVTAILSELLPVFLGNIPCNGVQVQSAETVCVYLSAVILSIMILIVGASFFVEWPMGMGIDPSTIAGAMYAAYTYSVGQPLRRFFREDAANMV